MNFSSESTLVSFAHSLGAFLRSKESLPLVIELVGDVGAGKTTFTRALAAGLGVKSPVVSPSFTISKRYTFPLNSRGQSSSFGTLIHYDFYRLSDPGLMSAELEEALFEPNSIIVLEWASSVENLLPDNRLIINFQKLSDTSRKLVFNPTAETIISKIPKGEE